MVTDTFSPTTLRKKWGSLFSSVLGRGCVHSLLLRGTEGYEGECVMHPKYCQKLRPKFLGMSSHRILLCQERDKNIHRDTLSLVYQRRTWKLCMTRAPLISLGVHEQNCWTPLDNKFCEPLYTEAGEFSFSGLLKVAQFEEVIGRAAREVGNCSEFAWRRDVTKKTSLQGGQGQKLLDKNRASREHRGSLRGPQQVCCMYTTEFVLSCYRA